MQRVTFILSGMEYTATFEDGDCASVYSHGEGRFLNVDNEKGERERSHVWTAAYTMAEG